MTPLQLLSVCAAAASLTACTAPVEPASPGLTLERVVVLHDGDHAAATYVDGTLAPPEAGHRDQLTTVRITDGQLSTAHVDVSNSVTAAPEVLALSPDGRTAFVAERLAQRKPGDTTASQLAPGTALTAVDLTDITSPTVAATAVTAEHPEALADSPDGLRIAVVANTPAAAILQLVTWADGTFGQPQTLDLTALGITGPGATNVHWHPSGRALAVNINTQNRVAFLAADEAPDGTMSVRPWGAAVGVGPDPFVGRFTPDGNHYVTANWGRDLSTTVASERLPREPSTLSVIEVGDLDDPAATHRVVAEAASDISSEGLAISPDGSWIATVNMRGTVFPSDAPNYDEHASVSLLRFDAASGALTKVGDTELTAVLPEGGAFDRTGEHFIATSFEGRGDDGGAGLQVFRVDDTEGLVPVQRIPLPHGVHHVVVG